MSEQLAVTGRSVTVPERTGEPPRPEWRGLFLEPDLPPFVEEDGAP